MPRFLLLLTSTPAQREDFSPTAIQAQTARFIEWVAKGSSDGVIHSGARLAEKSIKLQRAYGVTTVVEEDRKTIETRCGFFVIEAEDFNSALAIAAACPGADPGRIEVYQLDQAAAVGDAAALGMTESSWRAGKGR